MSLGTKSRSRYFFLIIRSWAYHFRRHDNFTVLSVSQYKVLGRRKETSYPFINGGKKVLWEQTILNLTRNTTDGDSAVPVLISRALLELFFCVAPSILPFDSFPLPPIFYFLPPIFHFLPCEPFFSLSASSDAWYSVSWSTIKSWRSVNLSGRGVDVGFVSNSQRLLSSLSLSRREVQKATFFLFAG